MSDSKVETDPDVEQKVADVTSSEGEVTATVDNTTDSVTSEQESAVKPDISNPEPPSDLEQKIIKQVEVSALVCHLVV